MAAVEENIDYEFDENVEDYNDDVDYEAEELEQDVVAHTSKKFKPDNSEKLLESSFEASRNNVSIGESAVKEDCKDDDVYASLLETKYSAVKSKYEEAQKEIKELKRKRKSAPVPAVANPDERVKQLEDRVALIKTKAKERIAEKDSIIEEQNEKLKKFEEILALLEVNCKQAVVKYNDAQVELAKKEETLQQHLSFKNRYDYKVNFLDEKCRKQKNEYEIKIRKLEEKLGVDMTEVETEVTSDKEQIKSDISDVKENDLVYPKKPKTLRIAKVEPKSGKVEPKKSKVEPKKAKVEPKSKLPKVVKGLTIKEVLPSDETVNDSNEETKEDKVTEEVPRVESKHSVPEVNSEAAKDESKELVTKLPGVKITLTDAINELDQIDFQEPTLE